MVQASPIAGKNALDAVAFVFQFARAFLEGEVESLLSLEQRLKDELPRFDKVQTVMVNLSDQGAMQNTGPINRLTGVLLQHFQESGKPDWALRVSNNQIIVNCLSYSRWAEVWPKCRRWLLLAAQAIDSESNGVTALATQFVDRFEYPGVPAEYSMGDVFNTDSRFLTAQANESNSEWHVFQGWFVNDEECPVPDSRLLSVLNLSSAVQNDRLQAMIDHTAQLNVRAVPIRVTELLGPVDALAGSDRLNACFDALHLLNKSILRETLAQSQLRAIGFEG